MNDKVKKIIDRANQLMQNGMSKLDVAKFVHLELGKSLIFDNSYTAVYNKEKNEDLTIISKKRQEMLLSESTNASKKEQICKGMAEIYVAILNAIDITSKVVGAENKGDIDGSIKKDGTTIDVPEMYDCSFNNNFEIITGKSEKSNNCTSQHYYAIFQIDGNEYIQDFLIDNALFRIKTGEASLNESMPGLCPKEEYSSRSKQSLPLSIEFIKEIKAKYEEYTNEPNVGNAFCFLFEQLKKYNEDFGFEESKDFLLSVGKEILPKDFDSKDLKIINLLKENQDTCDIVSIYRYNENNYLLRGGDETTAVKDELGKIDTAQIENLLSQGFEARKKSDELALNEVLVGNKSNISMEKIVTNAVTQGITLENLKMADRIENQKSQENQIEKNV